MYLPTPQYLRGGGVSLTDTDLYSYQEQQTLQPLSGSETWSQLANSDYKLTRTASVALNGKIYTVGGNEFNTYEGQGDLWAVGGNKLQVYDIATNSYTYDTFPNNGCFTNIVTDGTNLFVVGGSMYADGYWGASDILYKYTVATKTWTRLVNMPTKRVRASSVYYNGKIYVFGGDPSNENLVYNTVEVYDIATNTWSLTPMTMPEHLSRLVVVVNPTNGLAYITMGDHGVLNQPVNGSLYPTHRTNKLWEFNLNTGSYRELASAPIERTRHNSVYYNGKIYVIGGDSDTGELKANHIYTISTNTWTIGTDMILPIVRMGMSQYGGKIYLTGGDYWDGTKSISVNTTYSYDISNPALTIKTNQKGVNYNITGTRNLSGTMTDDLTVLSLPDGTYNIALSKSGYNSVSSGNFTHNSDSTKTLNLTPKTYTVTFNSNGGSTIPNKTVTFDALYNLTEVPYREGYTFLGWYKDVNLTQPITDSTIVTNANNHTVYAKWSMNYYKVSGIVTDENGNKVNNVKITINNKYITTTNQEGYYEYNMPYQD